MIAIAGAGPSGTYLAYLLAKQGHDVHVFHDSNIIGLPIQCTGLVTEELFKLVPHSKEYIVNTLDGATIHGPASTVTIPLKEYVICRRRFDNHLADMARAAGARIHLGHRLIGIEGKTAILRHEGKRIERPFDILIGADGPRSAVAQAAGLARPRRFWIGLQATLKGSFDAKKFSAHFGDCAPQFFGWVVPESGSVARVGVATEHKTREHFEAFLSRIGGEVIERQAGPIPIYDGKQRAADPARGIYLVGDAAGVVKATTGGGIITGMLSSKALAEAIQRGGDYEAALRPLRRELWIHQRIRRSLNRFRGKDYDRLIGLMGNRRVKDILAAHPREFPSRFMLKLLAAEPRLLSFARFAI